MKKRGRERIGSYFYQRRQYITMKAVDCIYKDTDEAVSHYFQIEYH